MFIIDFSASESDILSTISNRDNPAWTIPVFDFIRQWIDGADRFEVQTSGSTGTPKVIQHSRNAMIASAERTCDFFHLKNGDTSLLALPATHIGGKMMIVRSMVKGFKLICLEPKGNPLKELSYHGVIEFAAFTPMQMSAIMEDKQTNEKLSQIRKIILGGGEVSYPIRQQLQAISPEVYETYGMTETVSHIALKKINGSDSSDYFTVFEGVKITTDERGCLMIKAPHLSTETLITNDIVHIISETAFQWLGRYDNMINTGGIKVSAEEIERKLQPYIDVNFFIAGIPDDVLGQHVALIIESVRPEVIKQDYEMALGKYEKPKQILRIEKFVYTDNGKINKKETIKAIIQQ